MGARGNRDTQIPLDLPHAVSFDGADFFVAESNEAAFTLIDSWPDWSANVAAIWGPPGSGKSHLAQIWRRRSGAIALAGADIVASRLVELSETDALLIEDVAPPLFDETSLFHLLNLTRERRQTVLITSEASPAAWVVGLADLGTRLRAIPAAGIREPDDALLRAVMVKMFADRQVSVDETVVSYILARAERSLGAISDIVERLDKSALAEKTAISRPFATRVLQDLFD